MKGLVIVAHGLSGSLACGTRDQICVPTIGRQILNYWTSREVLEGGFLTTESSGKSLLSFLPSELGNYGTLGISFFLESW